ncbi:hypothetical protein BGZ73_003649 [Actinomortierella ambigua]|nr:hypothetical protein BGZ73_003649 [Actinomortierella ambigua]
MGESEYWNVHADDAMYHQPRSDSENEEHHGSANSGIKPKTASPSSTTLTAPNRRNTANRTGTRTHRPKPTLQQTRSWQENVDLPFILSAYAQLLLNMILVACLFAIGYNAYATIQEEVSTELSKAELQRGKKYDECRRAYDTTCRGETLLEGTMMYCKGLQQCIEENTHIVGKAVLSARTYATIANAFVHTLTWKTMMFLLLLVLGGLFVSNYALNSYRTNYVLHHQHHIATNSTSKPHDRKKSSNSPFLPRLPADSNEFNNNANADARTPEYIDDDRARRRLLPAASRFDPPENGGDSSESDVDMASTRRVMALPSS